MHTRILTDEMAGFAAGVLSSLLGFALHPEVWYFFSHALAIPAIGGVVGWAVARYMRRRWPDRKGPRPD